jgi:hypothetical protein
MTLGEDSNARAAALADNSTIPARSHQRFLTLFMDAALRRKHTCSACTESMSGAEEAEG